MPKSPEPEGSPRLMTTTEIARKHGVSRQTIHTYRRTGVFPAPVEGEGSTRPRFREDEVAAFFKANPKQPRKKRRFPPKQQGDPVITTTDARADLYAFAMLGKEHSPSNSDTASEKINAFRAAELREAAAWFEASMQAVDTTADPRYWQAIHDVVIGLRARAEQAQGEEA